MPGFVAQCAVVALSQYQQLLSLLSGIVAKAGSINVFVVFDCTDGGV